MATDGSAARMDAAVVPWLRRRRPPALAHCSGGPTSQADCVSGCKAVRNSKCLAQYQALYNCGGGSNPSYSCLSNGQVSLKGCDDKATALYSCLAMP